MKNITAIAIAATIALTAPVSAEEALGRSGVRTDCLTTITKYMAQGQKEFPDFILSELTDAEQSAILDKKGPPPVDAPFSFALAHASINGEKMAQLIIHDGDCVLFGSPTLPESDLNKFIGRSEASNG